MTVMLAGLVVQIVVNAAAIAARAVPAEPPVEARAPEFVFESRFWPNLHHFLYVLGRAESGAADRMRAAVAGAPLDTAGFGALGEADRGAWRDVVAYYAREISRNEIGFGPLVPYNYRLAATPDDAPPPPELPAALRDALLKAAPIYRTVWWQRHDGGNREWIAGLRVLLGRHGEVIGAELARAFRADWELRVPVQVVRWAMWAGAYMTEDPTLVHMSSAYAGHEGGGGLEMVFHEAGHALIVPTVDAAIRREAEVQQRRVAEWDISHAILFFTAGYATRVAIPDHVPYTQRWGLDTRGSLPPHLALAREHWSAYLRGERSFEDALRAMVRGAPELAPR
jgi:hypothetical protein